MKKHLIVAALAATGMFVLPAQGADEKAGAGNGSASQSAALYDGEIRKIDKSAAKITLRHGPMPQLDMPPMTMVFQVKDKALLDQVKPGDKVKFDAEKIGGAFVVTRIEAAP